jgi:choline dehydrogenase-like flavoprotein
MQSDVVIVGGGTAGSTLALILARRGAIVTVLERQRDYADRVRGEYVHPWGVAEAHQLRLVDILLAAGGVFVTRASGTMKASLPITAALMAELYGSFGPEPAARRRRFVNRLPDPGFRGRTLLASLAVVPTDHQSGLTRRTFGRNCWNDRSHRRHV